MNNENKIASEIKKLVDALKEKGLGDDFSVVVVGGVRETGEVTCTHLLSPIFATPTLEALDKMVAVMKVGGGNGVNIKRGILTEDENGVTELIDADDEERIQAMASESFITQIKEQWATLVDTIGEDEAKKQLLQPIVRTVITNHGAWDKVRDMGKKISLIAEFLAEVKSHPETSWLPCDYSDREIAEMIRYMEHVGKFGYAPTDKDDIAFG